MTNQQHTHSGNGLPPDEQLLLQYLRGELSPEKKALLEQQLNDSEFEAEALEGLSQFTDHSLLPDYVNQINNRVSQKLKQQGRRKRRPLPTLKWIYLSLFIILSLAILAYIVIHFLQ